jgi:hypothetical protein
MFEMTFNKKNNSGFRTFTLPILTQRDGKGWGYKLRYEFDGGKQDFWVEPHQLSNATLNEADNTLTFIIPVELLRRKGGALSKLAACSSGLRLSGAKIKDGQMYQIEKNVPMPPTVRVSSYPFAQMDAGGQLPGAARGRGREQSARTCSDRRLHL